MQISPPEARYCRGFILSTFARPTLDKQPNFNAHWRKQFATSGAAQAQYKHTSAGQVAAQALPCKICCVGNTVRASYCASSAMAKAPLSRSFWERQT